MSGKSALKSLCAMGPLGLALLGPPQAAGKVPKKKSIARERAAACQGKFGNQEPRGGQLCGPVPAEWTAIRGSRCLYVYQGVRRSTDIVMTTKEPFHIPASWLPSSAGADGRCGRVMWDKGGRRGGCSGKRESVERWEAFLEDLPNGSIIIQGAAGSGSRSRGEREGLSG